MSKKTAYLLIAIGAALWGIIGLFVTYLSDLGFTSIQVAVTPFSRLGSIFPLFSNPRVWLYIIGLGFFSTMLAYTLYTKGLNAVESSRASIIATIEPVVASLVSFLVFNEKPNLFQYIGITLVLAAVLLVQESSEVLDEESSLLSK